jgi:hypothetical protein
VRFSPVPESWVEHKGDETNRGGPRTIRGLCDEQFGQKRKGTALETALGAEGKRPHPEPTDLHSRGDQQR